MGRRCPGQKGGRADKKTWQEAEVGSRCPEQEGGRVARKTLKEAEVGSRFPGQEGGRVERKQSERECPIQAPRRLVEAAPKQKIVSTGHGVGSLTL